MGSTHSQTTKKDVVVIPEFVDSLTLQFIKAFVLNIVQTQPHRMMPCKNHRPNSFNLYDPLFEAILFMKRPHLEHLLNQKLVPLAAMGRVYKRGARLPPHTDLAIQEYSVSLQIHQTRSNHVYVVDPVSREKQYLPLRDGDAVLIPGADITHGRDAFDDELLIQLVFHYVQPDHPDLGCPKYSNEFTYKHLLGDALFNELFANGLATGLANGLATGAHSCETPPGSAAERRRREASPRSWDPSASPRNCRIRRS